MRMLIVIFLLLMVLPGFTAEQKKSPTQLDACSLLSQERVEEILGEKAKSPKQIGGEDPQPGATTAAVSTCTWESVSQRGGLPKRTITLWVRRAPAAVNDSGQVMESFRKDPKTGAPKEMQALPGFGDAAFWMSGKMGEQTRAELDAMKKDLVVQVVITGHKDAITAQSAAKTIVEKVWEKLGLA